MLTLMPVGKHDPLLRHAMKNHYSQPKGFVGRSICYNIWWGGTCYGSTVGGSATRFLPGRNEFFGTSDLNTIVNNIFFSVHKVDGRYPVRNFVPLVIREWRRSVVWDWFRKYGDPVLGFETLVELPRTGECYRRDGWTEVGITKGYTCKRTGGQGTDSWTGKRVWDTVNLRPKIVLCKKFTP